ncbi:conserved hypothetical protein [Microcystis aeruginosa PCC 9806]|uniref:DUF4926 domain-containing protein n=2 Tax=Microcystis TaxID=1125 RepID=A0A552L7R5_9CHRO|nr:hypothetical protein [Microcystis aeruginosa]TRV16273.1 MAG: DUF4926 domain-containing protein [Microcystis flos-aquae Mf_WU_F_19750830_S460]CCI16728.1 conserved hypothetical protein [Microcystis aeruginosa PCC 9806]
MSKFKLFEDIQITEDIPLTDGVIAPIGTVGAGEAYLVELFGDWVKYDEQGNFVSATQTEKEAFMETIGADQDARFLRH